METKLNYDDMLLGEALIHAAMSKEELEHHGIKGQKWGVRRFQNKDGSLTPLGKTRYSGEYKLKYESPMTDTVKSFAKNFASHTLASLIPGYATVHNAFVLASYATTIRNTIDGKDYTKSEGSLEKLSDLKKKSDTQSNDISVDDKKVNPRFGQQAGKVNNCMYCSATMEMRQRGYDVIARSKAKGTYTSAFKEWFDGVDIVKPNVQRNPKESRKNYTQRVYNQVCNDIEKFGNGARGFVTVAYEKVNSGHAMYWKVDNGRVSFYDGQNGSTKNDRIFGLSNAASYAYGRLDNCKLKDGVTEVCRSNPFKEKEKKK